MKTPRGLHLTGRIAHFLQNPHGRLPVSCTVFVVNDDYSVIADSLRFTSYGLRYGAGVALHLQVRSWQKRQFPFFVYCRGDHPDIEQVAALPNFVADVPADADVLRVSDSMERVEAGGDLSIEACWTRLFLQPQGRPLVLDFSLLRPAGARNRWGLVASGPASFARIANQIHAFLNAPSMANLMALYSRLNEIIRRGGVYKNGAITLHLDADHPELETFLRTPREEAPWVRLAVNVEPDILEHPCLELLLSKVRSGDVFLVKKQYGPDGQRIFHNVCLEVLLPHRGTCLLAHVNLGVLQVDEIPQAFEEGMEWLCDFHGRTGIDYPYLSPREDRQVGLGVLGLANLLAIEGVRYRELVDALEGRPVGKAGAIAEALREGYRRAAAVARRYGMVRAFAIAPTANCSFQGRDRHGYTTAPEIAPPVDRQVVRLSETTELQEADYHPDCEIAVEVGWDVYFRLVDAWQRMMDATGLAHAISANWWSDQVHFDREMLRRWLASGWKSLYYALPVQPQLQDKSEIVCLGCAE